MIDDGSTDKSLDICNKFAAMDSRIIVKTKHNEGQGRARNLGLDIAKGEYVGFIDSDDWIESTMYETLLKNILDTNSDISCCEINSCIITDNDDFFDGDIKVLDNYSAMERHLQLKGGIGHSPVDKLYKRQLFKDIRFISTRGYEDAGTIFKLFMNANKVVYQNIPLYYYCIRENSTMTREFSIKDYDRIVAYEEMEKTLKLDSRYSNLVYYATNYKLGAVFYVAGECYMRKPVGEKDLKKSIDKLCKNLIKYKSYNTLKQKILIYIIYFMPLLYKYLYILNKGGLNNDKK